MVGRVGDVQVPRAIHRDRFGRAELCLRRRATVAAEARRAIARDGLNTAEHVDLPHAVVPGVRNVEVARRVEREPRRPAQPRRVGSAAITGIPLGPRPRDRDDSAVHQHFANGMVPGVGDVEVAGVIESQAPRRIEPRGDGRIAVPRISVCVGSVNSGHAAEDA